jgi:hypothetical protein
VTLNEPTPRQRSRHRNSFFIRKIFIALLTIGTSIIFFINLTSVCFSQEGEDITPAVEWQVKGIQSALNNPLPAVQLRAREQIKSFSRVDGVKVFQVAGFLSSNDKQIVAAAASALGATKATNYAADLIKILRESVNNLAGRNLTTTALRALGPLSPNLVLPGLSVVYYFDRSSQPEIRFLCHYLMAGDPAIELVLQRIMSNDDQKPTRLKSIEPARRTLEAFRNLKSEI